MKIICVDYNYPAYNKEQNVAFSIKTPVVYTKPDSAILKDGKPFFLPDFSENIGCRAGIVLRICRLGKNISKRFAGRYYDAVTLGVDFQAMELVSEARENGLPYALYDGFDGSAVLGDFIAVGDLKSNMSGLDFCFYINGNRVSGENVGNMLFGFDDIIEYVSRFYTLKIGDLIYTGFPNQAVSVAIDDRLHGIIDGREVLNFYVR